MSQSTYEQLMNRHTDFHGKNPREVVTWLKREHENCKDFKFSNPKAFKLQLIQTPLQLGGKNVSIGYYVEVQGKKYIFTEQAGKQICNALGMDYKYFTRYPDRAEFVEHIHKLLPLKMKEGLIVRVRGNQVRAVVPHTYKILDDDQVIETLYGISQKLPNFKGIECFREPDGSNSFYRLVFGKSALERDSIFPTLVVTNSETDEAHLTVNLGTFRVACGNGSISQGIDVEGFSWNHRGDFRREIPKIRLSIERIVKNAAKLESAIMMAANKGLEAGFEGELNKLRDMRLGSKYYVDALKNYASSTNAQPKTKYDMFNLMTLMAQRYKVVNVRKAHEVRAHRYLITG